jgi:transposase
MEQRWLLVYSEQAYKREKKTFERKVAAEGLELTKDAWHLSNQIFQCEQDALNAAKLFETQYKYHVIESHVDLFEKFSGRGRPNIKSLKTKMGYKINITFSKNETQIAEKLATKGRFILATSELDENILSKENILYEYKEQNQVERGFRFLKDPWFMVDSVFLKKNERIEALMVIMTLCLMVYNVGEYRLREKLKEKKETLPNQVKKQITNPTLRWIFKIFQGISVVRVNVENIANKYKEYISNIRELTERIIRYFGKNCEKIYGLAPLYD